MCGIAGFTHLGSPFVPDRIDQAVASISHRGPDEQGVWQSESASLGSTRLRVIDNNDGSQPMFSEDKDYVLVFNGEIYNHRELRRELEGLGHSFHSSCDTEVLLRAFMQWDTGCLEKLRGMFGFAVWRESLRRLVLVRDRLGIKPLYYACRGRNIYFGSELKTILCHPEIEHRIDPHALETYLGLNYVPGPETMVEGIVKLAPGSMLIWSGGHVSTSRYWKPSRNVAAGRSLRDSVGELDELLHQSVTEHLAADVPVGLWLSGGLDSSTILHYAAQHSSNPVKTFSITFNGREFDEASYIRAVSAKYSTIHHELDLGPETASPDAIADFAYYADEPNADAGAVPVWFLSQMSASHVTVALSGEGADELFGGYITYKADRYARFARSVPRGIRRAALHSARKIAASDKKIGLDYKLQRFLQGALMDERSSHVFWNGTFSEEERGDLLLTNRGFGMRKLLESIPQDGDGKRFLAFDQDYFLPDNILTKVDRMSMAHSLEVRPPFLDHRIVEFAGRLPLSHCIQGSRLKVVLRELMGDKLPQNILTKKKHGLDIPVHGWLRGHLKPLLLDTLNKRAVEESGLFRWSYIESILTQHLQRKANYGYHLWGLLMLFLWIKQWKIECNLELQVTEEYSTVSA